MIQNSVTILLLLAVVKSAKILVAVPTPSVSHQIVFRSLINELINRNHEVISITTDPIYEPNKSPKNLTEIDLHDLSYGLFNKVLIELEKEEKRDNLYDVNLVIFWLSTIFEELLKSKSVHKLITDKTVKFDLLILETHITPNIIFSHIFKAPVIQMSSFGANPGNMEMMGVKTHPLLYPSHYQQKLYNLTTWGKINELYQYMALNKIFEKLEVVDNKRMQCTFGPDVPTLSKLKNNVDMLFLNIHPIWLHNQPVPPNVILTWGIHKMPAKILPEDLQSYLDSSKYGVIYVSFGTNVKSSVISQEILDVLLQVFAQLPYNILLKWDNDELPGKSENIKISKWLPQVDVLRHPNVKLFITQGGLQSTEEAINAGVPMIGIPFFADQEYNTAKYDYFKIGIKLNLKSFSLKDLQTAIMSIFTDYESYQKNIIDLRRKMQDHSKPPLQNVMWWIDYVLRHGGAKHLRTSAANMSWTEYYELELLLVVLSGLIVLGMTLLICVNFCCKYIKRIIVN